jgi:hypothetical protein
MEPTLPRSRLYYITVEEMNFTVTKTLRASRVEKWIRTVKQRFLDAAPIKCVGLDCEFTSPREDRHNQRAAILQLSVASEALVFQICWTNRVPQLLKEFLKDITIRFCSAAIANDVHMLSSYGIEIPSAYDLQKIVPNPTKNLIPSLHAAVTQHTTACCSTQVVDITLMKLHFTNITSLRVVQQKHCGSTYKLLLLQAK